MFYISNHIANILLLYFNSSTNPGYDTKLHPIVWSHFEISGEHGVPLHCN